MNSKYCGNYELILDSANFSTKIFILVDDSEMDSFFV